MGKGCLVLVAIAAVTVAMCVASVATHQKPSPYCRNWRGLDGSTRRAGVVASLDPIRVNHRCVELNADELARFVTGVCDLGVDEATVAAALVDKARSLCR